jgi:EAL domain-containing protein (putative c-di-GMP-specific phosphodiesterase class I)
VVRAVVDIARGLGKRTVAEFVEDAETLELLRGMGVDFAQGYHVAKPSPLPLVHAPLPHLENA